MSIRTILGSALGAAALLATIPAVAPPAVGTPAVATPAVDLTADARTGQARTSLTFTVDDCEGCEVQLVNALQTRYTDVRVWSSRAKEVLDGVVTFDVPTKNTRGMSATVRAPWEGQTGYVTTVAWRYNGKAVGDAVTLAEAVTRKRASACWDGTRRRDVTVPLVVEQVEVEGVRRTVPGSIAFVPTTASWQKPMREVVAGVLGSQDVNICG